MYDNEPPEIIDQVISSAGKKCASLLRYTSLSSQEINQRIDRFHAQVGPAPTFEQIQEFNYKNGGINCGLYAEAACDLLRANGITADRVNLLDPSSSDGAADNHAVVYAANRVWLEPQGGEIFSCSDWDTFAGHYARLLKIDPADLVAYSPRDGAIQAGPNWTIPES